MIGYCVIYQKKDFFILLCLFITIMEVLHIPPPPPQEETGWL